MTFGAGWELRHMSISELMHRPERTRRMEVFTGAGRRRNWPVDEKAAIVAESYAPGKTGCGVAHRPRTPPSAAVHLAPARPQNSSPHSAMAASTRFVTLPEWLIPTRVKADSFWGFQT